MIKKILLILLVINSQIIFQGFSQVFNEEFEWKSVETQIDSKLKEKLVLETGFMKMYFEDMSQGNDIYLEYFHPIYINSDTLVDFIYSGPSGGEPTKIAFFINENGKLVEKYSSYGGLEIKRKNIPSSTMIFGNFNYGCCDEPLGDYREITIVSTKTGQQFIESEKVYFYDDIKFPEKITLNQWFKVKNDKYTLRATPEIINDGHFSYYLERGNIICELTVGDIGYAIASKTDETGRVWWFCIVENNIAKGDSFYHIRKEHSNDKWFGWISSRYVEPINL
jgi:hypothetical protein